MHFVSFRTPWMLPGCGFDMQILRPLKKSLSFISSQWLQTLLGSVSKCKALFVTSLLPFQRGLRRELSLSAGVPGSSLRAPALLGLPCPHPHCLAHCASKTRILRPVWPRPFAYAEPSAQCAEVPLTLQRPVKCRPLPGAYPGPTRFARARSVPYKAPLCPARSEHPALD